MSELDGAPDDVTQFPEAALWMLGRAPMTQDEWNALSISAQNKAFYVAGVAKGDLLNDVHRELDKAIATGSTLADFRKALKTRLEEAWDGTVSNPAWRMETICRTNIQAAYSAGRVAQMRDPDVADVRPYWQFDAIMDARTSPYCYPINGVILKSDDPWWGSHTPPLHFSCRSALRCLRTRVAERKGITAKPPKSDVAEGFGGDPATTTWNPDLKRFPPGLREDVAARLKTLKPTATLPRPAPKGARIVDKPGPAKGSVSSRAPALPKLPPGYPRAKAG